MNRTIAEKLKETAIEDIIWLVYLFIIGANLYSNYLERVYIKNHNLRSFNNCFFHISIFCIPKLWLCS